MDGGDYVSIHVGNLAQPTTKQAFKPYEKERTYQQCQYKDKDKEKKPIKQRRAEIVSTKKSKIINLGIAVRITSGEIGYYVYGCPSRFDEDSASEAKNKNKKRTPTKNSVRTDDPHNKLHVLEDKRHWNNPQVECLECWK
ncbi:9516_t:CDS:2 [Ambispora gerdemannii]|uniref:9516_t:CDS:1 n=1 Tax=Ambispora gerdemannii TaxID=144530 RepID=A0A9N9E0E4_9GLOM|nr:9516_t:CDS:2 [Ambispora gerdemannii]